LRELLSEEILRKLREEVSSSLPRQGTHSYEHTERVYRMCLFLGKKAGADESILLPAALLHDIGRGEENHALAGARKAKPILMKLGFSTKMIDKVADAISAHSYSERKIAVSVEAKVLSDADKLDALGAIGIYRAAAYSGEVTRGMDEFTAHFHEKLLGLAELFYTEDAKLIAKNRISFMRAYLDELNQELLQKA
jgi:uncharacterized protein